MPEVRNIGSELAPTLLPVQGEDKVQATVKDGFSTVTLGRKMKER